MKRLYQLPSTATRNIWVRRFILDDNLSSCAQWQSYYRQKKTSMRFEPMTCGSKGGILTNLPITIITTCKICLQTYIYRLYMGQLTTMPLKWLRHCMCLMVSLPNGKLVIQTCSNFLGTVCFLV